MQASDLMTVQEAAALLQMHVASVRRLLRQGQLPGIRLDGRWWVRRAALATLHQGKPARPARAGAVPPVERVPPLQQALTQAELLNQLIVAAAGEEDLAQLLAVALHPLQQVLPLAGGAIALLEADALVVRAALGPCAPRELPHVLPHGQGPLWQVVTGRQPCSWAALPADGLEAPASCCACLAVPLSWRGETFGVLSVASTDRGAFDPAAVAFLQRVAEVLSGPIQLAQRYATEVRAVQAARTAQRQLSLQYVVNRLLAQAGHFNEVDATILRTIGEHLDWQMGALWCIDRQHARLGCTTFWQQAGGPLNAFARACQGFTFRQGVGLPGRVWASGEPSWIADLHQDRNFPRLQSAAQEGFRSAFAFPLQGQRDFFGVMEFFSCERRSPDEALLQTMAVLGQQIGQYIERKRAEQAVQHRDAQRAATLDVALDAIIGMDHAGRIVEWNPAAEQLFGYSRQAALGQEMAALIIPPSLREAHRQGLARYLATRQPTLLGQRLELPALRADGSELAVELAITEVPSDGVPLFLGFVRDITARQQAEAWRHFLVQASHKLARSLDYETTLTTMTHLAVPYLADWCVVDLLDEAGNIQPGALHPSDPDSLLRVDELRAWVPADTLRAVLHGGQPLLLERSGESDLQPLAASGASVMIVPLCVGGHVLGALTLATATSGRRYTDKHLELAADLAQRGAQALDNARLHQTVQQALLLRDQFLTVASHELKTPITSLIGYLSLLQRRLPADTLSERNQRALTVVQGEAQRLNRLVDLLLDVSRIQEGRLQLEVAPIELGGLVRHLVEIIQPSLTWHSLELDCPGDPVPIAGDEARLEQVFHNLISNAVKYSPQGGVITVRVTRSDGYAAVHVRDQGLGIPAEALPHLFDRFYRATNFRREEIAGLGLGLHVVKEIVTLHGGRVDVTSFAGEGSTFTVLLPLRTVAAS